MTFFDVKQGSVEWHKLRRGLATSSNFDRIMTPKSRKLSAQVSSYIAEIIGEACSIYYPEHAESYMSNPMRHGVDTEDEARRFYCMERDADVTNGGFCLSDCKRFGASPDGLIGNEGSLELKCPQAKRHVEYLLEDELPSEYACQVHGQLIVTGRPWADFLSYHPGLPPFLKRVEPNDFTEDLRRCLDIFHERFLESLAKMKGLA